MRCVCSAGIQYFWAFNVMDKAADNCFGVGGNALGSTFVKFGVASQTPPGETCHFMASEQPPLFKSLHREFRTAGVRRSAQDNIHQQYRAKHLRACFSPALAFVFASTHFHQTEMSVSSCACLARKTLHTALLHVDLKCEIDFAWVSKAKKSLLDHSQRSVGHWNQLRWWQMWIFEI